jgi:hypothetical protein
MSRNVVIADFVVPCCDTVQFCRLLLAFRKNLLPAFYDLKILLQRYNNFQCYTTSQVEQENVTGSVVDLYSDGARLVSW